MTARILMTIRQMLALLLVYTLPVGTCPLQASVSPHWAPPQEQASAAQESVKISNDQLDSLVAPIALYPDPLLAQVLVAATYPLEVIQLQQWLDRNKGMKDKALTDAVQKQNWEASIQALAVLPDVVKILSENIKWTTDLGNAFLAQQSDVMDAVQRMRVKAKNSGNLRSTEQQKVETKVIDNKTVVVVQPSKPDVIYGPSYDPVVVYGPPVYAYPPMYYPPGYYAAGMALSFGMGVAVGAAINGGWGYGCGWGSNNTININNNNTFINNNNINNLKNQGQNWKNQNQNLKNQGGNANQWQHNPDHRGGTPYSDRQTANKYGGTSRGDSMADRQAAARHDQGRGMQQAGMREGGSMGRGTGQGAGTNMNRGGQGGAGSMGRTGGMGGERAGTQGVSRGAGSGAFGGASGGMGGSSARASQSRGASSMGSHAGGFGGSAGRAGAGRHR